jgi:organic radical activating enzyme
LSTVEVSEIFYSLEGESVETGSPTAYIRFARCNKKCPLWNNPDKELSKTGYATLDFDPKEFTELNKLPTISKGCDSQYAVNPVFAHMWKHYDAGELLQATLDTIPFKSWVAPSGLPVILSLTGGEPTLRLKWIVEELLPHPLFQGCKHILFETNCSVPLRQANIDMLYEYAINNNVKITWSNSPKLPNSGELWKTSIVPKIALAQVNSEWELEDPRYSNYVNVNQYFKFVVGSEEDLKTVEQAMNEYYAAGLPRRLVYLMPEACTTEQQENIANKVADMCMQYGYIFSIRLQSILWGNEIGT